MKPTMLEPHPQPGKARSAECLQGMDFIRGPGSQIYKK